MSQRVEIPSALRLLLIVACIVVTVAGLRVAAPMLVPLTLALFVAITSLPAMAWLRRTGFPTALAILVIVLLDSAILGFFGWILVQSAAEVSDALPAYLERFHELEAAALARLQRLGVEVTAFPYADLIRPERLLDLATSFLRSLTQLVSASVLVLILLVFMLSEAAGLPAKLRAALGERAGNLARFAPIAEEVQQFLLLKTLISLATGLLVGTAAAVLGVDFALFWGLLAFLLNFIPNIGSIIAALPAVALALLQHGLGTASALAAAYLVVNMVLGNLIEPMVMGRRLGLSTLVVMLSLVFWGWVWGAIGMILSLPLTMAAKIAFESTQEYRWIAVLLGPTPVPNAAPVPPAAQRARETPAMEQQPHAGSA